MRDIYIYTYIACTDGNARYRLTAGGLFPRVRVPRWPGFESRTRDKCNNISTVVRIRGPCCDLYRDIPLLPPETYVHNTGEFTIHPLTVAKVSRGSIDNPPRFMPVVNNKKKKTRERKKGKKGKRRKKIGEEWAREERERERGKKKGIEKYPWSLTNCYLEISRWFAAFPVTERRGYGNWVPSPIPTPCRCPLPLQEICAFVTGLSNNLPSTLVAISS